MTNNMFDENVIYQNYVGLKAYTAYTSSSISCAKCVVSGSLVVLSLSLCSILASNLS